MAQRFGAPFLTFHESKGERYVQCRTRDIVGSKFLPKSIIEKMSMINVMDKLLKSIGLKKFVDL